MSMLTVEEIQAFQSHGVVCLRGKFSETWINKIRTGLQTVCSSPSEYCVKVYHDDDPTMSYLQDECNMQRIDEFTDFVFKSPAASIVQQLMDTKETAFYCDFTFKEDPGQRKPIPWHQDQPYYPIDGWKFCSIWIPLYRVSKETCLRFIKGSHLWGDWYQPKSMYTQGNNEGHSWKDLLKYGSSHCFNSRAPDHFEELSWNLEPGDCLVVHGKTAHGAPAYVDQETEVFFTRWLGDDATIQPRPWKLASPVFDLPEHCQPRESIFRYPDLFPVVPTLKANDLYKN